MTQQLLRLRHAPLYRLPAPHLPALDWEVWKRLQSCGNPVVVPGPGCLLFLCLLVRGERSDDLMVDISLQGCCSLGHLPAVGGGVQTTILQLLPLGLEESVLHHRHHDRIPALHHQGQARRYRQKAHLHGLVQCYSAWTDSGLPIIQRFPF